MSTEKQDTKEKITNTSLELFANQGFHKTSISQIARQTGVSKSLIYNYFESKDHLLEHIVQEAIRRSDALLPHTKWKDISTLDQLMIYMKKMIEDLKANPSYYRLLIMLTLQGSIKQKVMKKLNQEKENLMVPIQYIMKAHRVDQPEKMSYIFGALFDGLILHYLYMEEEYPLLDLFEYFIVQLKKLIVK